MSEENTSSGNGRAFRIFAISFAALFAIFWSLGAPAKEPTETSAATANMDDNSKGNAFFSDGNYDSALWYYERVLIKKPDDQDGLYNKSQVYAMKQDYSQSIPIARRCLATYPDYNEAWWLLGYDYNAINNLDSAIYSLERAYNNDFRETSFLELMPAAISCA